MLTQISNRIDPHRDLTVKPEYLRHVAPGNPKGWWFVWNDPTQNTEPEGMLDYWTAQVVGRLYDVRRAPSAPPIEGIHSRRKCRRVKPTGPPAKTATGGPFAGAMRKPTPPLFARESNGAPPLSA
jgi:hypothetical protein